MACEICKGINSHLCPVCGDQSDAVKCDNCGGEGWLYYAYNIENGEIFRVSCDEYEELPDDEDKAYESSRKLCKGNIERCSKCNGEGEYVTDPEDYFDEDAYMERYYERKYGKD